MKSLWTQGNTHTHPHTRTHTHIPTLPGSEQNHTTEEKEANGETVQQNAEGSSFIPPLHPFTSQIPSVVSLLSAFCLSSLVSDPPRRIAAVKLLTSSSTSVMTLHSALNSPSVGVRVCGCQSVFDIFIGLSHDLGLNHSFRKEGEFLLSCSPLFVPFAPDDEPPAGGGAALH